MPLTDRKPHAMPPLALADESATLELGSLLASVVEAPFIVFLQGDLGAGKTCFSRGFLQARGHEGRVKSPTYTLIEPYDLPGATAYHLDLYRLGDAAELDYLGLGDYLASPAIFLIEWPERGAGFLPSPDLVVVLDAPVELESPGRWARLSLSSSRAMALQAALESRLLESGRFEIGSESESRGLATTVGAAHHGPS